MDRKDYHKGAKPEPYTSDFNQWSDLWPISNTNFSLYYGNDTRIGIKYILRIGVKYIDVKELIGTKQPVQVLA